jgi:short-subunit dehydrogenase
MKTFLKDKTVVIIGATGGLGSGIVKEVSKYTSNILLVGRNIEKMKATFTDMDYAYFDFQEKTSYLTLENQVKEWQSDIDVVINASGTDVRKRLLEHTDEDIEKTFDINIIGAIKLTKLFLPLMKVGKNSSILHIGGFADGRSAFPYYSADVASVAGLYSFIESINRELTAEESEIKVKYFCPSPADTEAEKPFHKLWQDMNIKILPVDRVAKDIVKLVSSKKTHHIMGGFVTNFFAKLNSLSPKLADVIVMKKYALMLKNYIYGKGEKKNLILKKIGIFLVVMSFVLYILLLGVPVLKVDLLCKAAITSSFMVISEIIWWTGVLILGKEVASKYRKFLNPKNWKKCT